MTVYDVRRVSDGESIGMVSVDEGGAAVSGSHSAAVRIVEGALRRAGGDEDALDGWTNGYVQVKRA